ncbi:MAG: hypothetical protein RIQ56_870 [Candidatus Parcubacteria bacterium]|jgi:putative endonuclease
MDHFETGRQGESIACEFLRRKGFRVISRNFRKAYGEIDIIALKDGGYRFVEVKTVTREMGESGSRVTSGYRPEEMAHEIKLRKVSKVADTYMESHDLDNDYQIDVVTVVLIPREKRAYCRLYEQVL